MQERKDSGETFTDMLGYLMKKDDNRYPLTDEEIRDQVVTILYSGYETVSTTSMMALKYLHDHPKALEELRVCPLRKNKTGLMIHRFNMVKLFDIGLFWDCRESIWLSGKENDQTNHSI